jgi:hypothetical protein
MTARTTCADPLCCDPAHQVRREIVNLIRQNQELADPKEALHHAGLRALEILDAWCRCRYATPERPGPHPILCSDDDCRCERTAETDAILSAARVAGWTPGGEK